MKKIATIAAIALAATTVEGSCATNWITTAAGLDSTGNSGTSYAASSSFATCNSIKTSEASCCATTEIAKFQTKADTLVSTLKTAVSTRDQFIMDRRGDVLSVRDSLNSIQASITKIASDKSISVSDSLATFFSGYDDMISTFTEDFTALKAAFITYQKNRMSCFNALVQAQVAIWCGACTETLYGITANTQTILYEPAFTGPAITACSPYIASAIEQSEILSLYYVSDYLATLADALDKLANGDATGAATALAEFFTDYTGITTPTDTLKKVAGDVGTCTTSSCDWIFDTLFTNGVLNTDLAAVGGAVAANSRLLQSEIEAPAGRMLPGIATVPADEATGISVDFPENPGNVDNDQNSAVRNGAIACAITALAALL